MTLVFLVEEKRLEWKEFIAKKTKIKVALFC